MPCTTHVPTPCTAQLAPHQIPILTPHPTCTHRDYMILLLHNWPILSCFFSSFWTTQKAKAMICQHLGDLSQVSFVEIGGACVPEDGNKPTWLVTHLKFILPQLTSKPWQSIILRFFTNTTIQTFYNLHKIQMFILRFLVTVKMSQLRFTNH